MKSQDEIREVIKENDKLYIENHRLTQENQELRFKVEEMERNDKTLYRDCCCMITQAEEYERKAAEDKKKIKELDYSNCVLIAAVIALIVFWRFQLWV